MDTAESQGGAQRAPGKLRGPSSVHSAYAGPPFIADRGTALRGQLTTRTVRSHTNRGGRRITPLTLESRAPLRPSRKRDAEPTPRARARRAHRSRPGGRLTFDRMSTAPSGLAHPGAPDGGGGAGGRRGPFARGHEKRQLRGAGRGPGGKKTPRAGGKPRRPNAAQAGTPGPQPEPHKGRAGPPTTEPRARGGRRRPRAQRGAGPRTRQAGAAPRAPRGPRERPTAPHRPEPRRAPKGPQRGPQWRKRGRPKGRARAATTERRGRREAPQAHSRAPERRSAGRKAEHEGPQRGPSGARGSAPELPGIAAVHDLILGQYSVSHDGIRRSDYAREAAWQVSEKFGFIRTEAMIS